MPKVFVYGAQMAHPESEGAAWPARVRGHAVRFVARGVPGFEPVFAALEPAAGETAHGVTTALLFVLVGLLLAVALVWWLT